MLLFKSNRQRNIGFKLSPAFPPTLHNYYIIKWITISALIGTSHRIKILKVTLIQYLVLYCTHTQYIFIYVCVCVLQILNKAPGGMNVMNETYVCGHDYTVFLFGCFRLCEQRYSNFLHVYKQSIKIQVSALVNQWKSLTRTMELKRNVITRLGSDHGSETQQRAK